MAYGKRGLAPCGHPGEAVVGQYYRCLEGCDEEFGFRVVDLEAVCCPNPLCGRDDEVDLEFAVDPVYYMYNPAARVVDTRCRACGAVWTR